MAGNAYTRVRRRPNVLTDEGHSTRFILGGQPSRETYRGFGSEVTSDRNNHWLQWRQVKHNADWVSAWDVGGPFESVKTRVTFGGSEIRMKYFPHQGDFLYRFEGLLVPGLAYNPYSWISMPKTLWNPTTFEYSDTASLDQFGAEAIQATIPNAPHADVFQQVEELRREGLPKLPLYSFLKNKGAGTAAGEYLNYQFGIAPTVGAIQEDLDAIRNAAEILSQYHRDSGRLVRRKLSVPEETVTTDEVYSTSLYPRNTVPGFFNYRGPLMRTVKTTRKRWFSAAYRYYAPVDPTTLQYYLGNANALLGTNITPEKMFALSPWSWMLDWFTNSGEMLSAIETFRQEPNLLRWGYVMEHMQRTTTYEQNLVTNEGVSVVAKLKLEQERKIRRRATPFGFGFSEEDLSTKQKSILVALGISKLPFG